jgi:transposase
MNEAVNAKRMMDVQNAIAEGMAMTQLAELWGVSRPAVSQWCDRFINDADRAALRANANIIRGDKRRNYVLAARLELLAACRAAGMSFERIAAAMGVSGVSLWTLAHRHAPDGLAAAVEDFRDDEAA